MGRQARLALTIASLDALLVSAARASRHKFVASRCITAECPVDSRIYGDVAFPTPRPVTGPRTRMSGRLGFGAFGVTAIFSSLNPDGPAASDLSIGATLNYKIFGGPLVPLGVTLARWSRLCQTRQRHSCRGRIPSCASRSV